MGQTILDKFGFTHNGSATSSEQSESGSCSHKNLESDIEMRSVVSDIDMKSIGTHTDDEQHETRDMAGHVEINIRKEYITPPPLTFEPDAVGLLDEPVRVREESATPPPLQFNLDLAHSLGDANVIEPWEDEIHEALAPKPEIQPWPKLRDQIKKDLKRKANSLTQINQLLIIRNFATLRIKGNGRMGASFKIAEQWHEGTGSQRNFACHVRALARHYQVFEQLPMDKRGGSKNATSLLKDESVSTAAWSWLTEQKVGSITPQNFRHALNDTILPALGISTRKPLCERTARRWLIKLGWSRIQLRKGVYMDGHEREDVIRYREKVFLPQMKEYERRMAKYEGPELKRVEPHLGTGEKELIAEWQDESCFQQYDFVTSLW